MHGGGPLRIVLLGLPRAGKTALLAALGQLRNEQPGPLQGQLADKSGGLERQRQLFYDEIPRPTEDELTEYPVHFNPDGGRRAGGPVDAVLIDCDGRQVMELLNNARSLEQGVARSALDRAVLHADAILVATDATSSDSSVERTLSGLGQVLGALERGRAARAEIGGLPVFVVLTKADLLAGDDDNLAEWTEKVEARKRQASSHFFETLGGRRDGRTAAFGRLDVHLWATSLKRPALKGNSARPREPYGVAELFRQCLRDARRYRQRHVHAERRLRLTLGGTMTLLGALATLVFILLTGLGRHEPSDLERRIEEYRLKEGSNITARLHDWPEDLERRRGELAKMMADPEFKDLGGTLREYVVQRDGELDEYIPYLKKVLSQQFATIARNDEQIAQRRKKLEEELKPPHEEWTESGAGKIRQQRLDDLKILAERADRAVNWFQQLRRDGIALWTFRKPVRTGPLLNWRGWQDEVDRYLSAAAFAPPAVENLPPTSLVTPNTILRFDRVKEAREEVSGRVRDLAAVRNLSSALGLGDPTVARPPLLEVPRPPSFPLSVARERWHRLGPRPEQAANFVGMLASPGGHDPLLMAVDLYPGTPLVSPYPEFEETFTLDRVPDDARPTVIQVAGNSYQNLVDPMRDAVLAKYRETAKGQEETPAFWKDVGRWIKTDPPELRPYRRLATVLGRLLPSSPSEPAGALARFFDQDSFPLVLKGATLTIPDDYEAGPPDNAVLVVQSGTNRATFTLDPAKTKRDAQNRQTTYTFTGQTQRLNYAPGEAFSVTLTVRNNRVLTWNEARTRSYGFEALSHPPRLHEKDRVPTRDQRADGIVLKFDADGLLPTVPDLLPDVSGGR